MNNTILSKDINTYIEGYLNFLRSNSFGVKLNDNTYKLEYPFLDSSNDFTEIYIIKNDNEYIITDNGETLANLSFNGVEIKGDNRKDIFNKILQSYGIKNDNGNLYIVSNSTDLFLKKHMLIQCIIKINDMYVLSRANVQNIFLEDVKVFLYDNDIVYVQDHKILGRSGLYINYDFALGKRKEKPFTLIKTINKLDKEHIQSNIFTWIDTYDSLEKQAQFLVIYNDLEKAAKKEHIEALNKYDIKSFAWSKKLELKNYLIA